MYTGSDWFTVLWSWPPLLLCTTTEMYIHKNIKAVNIFYIFCVIRYKVEISGKQLLFFFIMNISLIYNMFYMRIYFIVAKLPLFYGAGSREVATAAKLGRLRLQTQFFVLVYSSVTYRSRTSMISASWIAGAEKLAALHWLSADPILLLCDQLSEPKSRLRNTITFAVYFYVRQPQ